MTSQGRGQKQAGGVTERCSAQGPGDGQASCPGMCVSSGFLWGTSRAFGGTVLLPSVPTLRPSSEAFPDKTCFFAVLPARAALKPGEGIGTEIPVCRRL